MRKVIMEWDTCKIIESQVDYLKENWRDTFTDRDKCPDEDELWMYVSEDSSVFEMAWEDLVDFLTEIMHRKNYRNYYKDKWVVEVNNFGWRHLDGHKCVTAKNGKELLREILPKCDCTFKIVHNGRTGLKIQNFHHDSPTGKEWYYIRPMTINEVEHDN